MLLMYGRNHRIGHVQLSCMPDIAYKYLSAFVKAYYDLHTAFLYTLQLNR